MNVIGVKSIYEFIKKHAQAESPVVAWLAEAKEAEWASRSVVQDRYGGRVSFTPQGNTVFRLGGNKYRLVARVSFNTQTMSIVWIGTHAEYNKRRF